MKHPILLLCITLLMPLWAMAQSGKIDAGVMYYNEGDFVKAVDKLREGLAAADMKPKVYAKGYTKLAQSYVNIYAKANNDKDPAAVAFQQANPMLLKDAFDALANAEKYDDTKSFAAEIKNAYLQVANGLYIEGATAFQKKDHDRAIPALQASSVAFDKVRPFYAVNQVLGYAQIEVADTAGAVASLSKAATQYTETVTADASKLDSNMFNVFALLIVIHNEQGKTQKALEFVDQGKKLYPPDVFAKSGRDITRYEIIVYQSPSMLEPGIVKFADLVKANPNNYDYQMIYAQLLEKKSNNYEDENYVKQAISVYNNVLTKKPNDLKANFNLGALHNNLAKKYNDQYNDMLNQDAKADDNLLKKLEDQKTASFKAALPHMEKALELEDDSAQRFTILSVLVQITAQLNMNDAADKYKKMRDSGN
jgi:tetratricopeptide (TPR) repeat protein